MYKKKMGLENGNSFNAIAGDAISFTPTKFNHRFERFYLFVILLFVTGDEGIWNKLLPIPSNWSTSAIKQRQLFSQFPTLSLS